MRVFFLSRRAPPREPRPASPPAQICAADCTDTLWLGPPALAENSRSPFLHIHGSVLGGGASATGNTLALSLGSPASEMAGTPNISGVYSANDDILSVGSSVAGTPLSGAFDRSTGSMATPHVMEDYGAPGALLHLSGSEPNLVQVRSLAPLPSSDGGGLPEGGAKRTSLDSLDGRTGALDSTTPRRSEEGGAANGGVSSAGPSTPAYGPTATPGRPSEIEDIDATIAYINKAHYSSPALNDLAQPSPRSSSGRFRLKRKITRGSLYAAGAAPPREGGPEPFPGGAPAVRALSGPPTRSPSYRVDLGECLWGQVWALSVGH